MSSDGGYTWYLSSYSDAFSLLLTYRWQTDAKTCAHRHEGNGVSVQFNIDGDEHEGWVLTQDILRVQRLPSWILVIFLCTNLNLLFVSLEWKRFVPPLLSCFYWWGVNASVLNIVGDRLNLYTHKHTLQLWAAEQAAYIDTLSHIKLNLLAKCCLFSQIHSSISNI